MEKQTVFIKRYPSKGELPQVHGYKFTNMGRIWFNLPNKSFEDDYQELSNPEWWLEEIELPSEEELNEKSDLKKGSPIWFHSQGFTQGANFILNKLKGG